MKVLLSLALVVWFSVALFMLDRAQENYCGVFTSQQYNEMLASGIPVVAFSHYSYSPEVSDAFPYLRDSLTDILQSGEGLRITGHYTKTESLTDKNLGLKRANALRMLFLDYINPDNIEIESKLSNTVSRAPLFEVFDIYAEEFNKAKSDLPMMEHAIAAGDAMAKIPEVEKVAQTREEVAEQKLDAIAVGKTDNTEKPVAETIAKPKVEKIEPSENLLDNTNSVVTRTGKSEADYVIYFKDKSSDIIMKKEVQQYLNALSKRVKKTNEKIEIIGFDDNSRTAEESLALSKRRTWRVRKGFLDDRVRRKLVKVKNDGQSNPAVSNDTEEGRAQNRRVEIRILKK